MRRSKAVRLGAAVAGLSLVLVACGDDDGGSSGGGDGKPGGTFRLGITEPVAIDPYNAQESEGILVTTLLFDGLTDATPDGQVVNAMATSRERNADCTEWTFKVKKGAKFHNGEVVDASSFKLGWTRLIAKAAASDVAYHLTGIAGFADLNGGKATTLSGVTAPDAETLVVKLTKGDCEFDLKTVHPLMSPVSKAAGAANNKAHNDLPIGNGPFKMAGAWQHNRSISLVRNDDYYGKKANLDKVEISILNPANSIDLEYAGFQSGRFDWSRIPKPQLTAAKARFDKDGKFLSLDTNGMNYLLPVTDNGPMKSKEARLAVSYAIDRKAITAGVFKGFLRPASTIVAPAFKDFHQEGLCESCKQQDQAKAKELAQQAGLPAGSTVKLAFNTGAGHEEWVQAIKQQLETVLGWKITLQGVPFPDLLAAQQAKGATGLFRFAWGADFPTVDNYLYSLLHTDAIKKDASGKVVGDNRTRYSNPAFDKLVSDARAETDQGKKDELRQEAEKIAMEDVALIPLWYRTEQRLAATDKFTNLGLDFNENPTLEDVSIK